MSAAQHPPGSAWANPQWAFDIMESNFRSIHGGICCLLESASANNPSVFQFIAWALEKEMADLRVNVRQALNLPAEEIDQ